MVCIVRVVRVVGNIFLLNTGVAVATVADVAGVAGVAGVPGVPGVSCACCFAA